MPIDNSFFPNTDALTTYLDDVPRFKRKQLVIPEGCSNEKEELISKDDNTEELKQKDSKFRKKDKKFHIEKIYHAQCLEKYPKHFTAFVKLSIVKPTTDLDQLDGDNILLCLLHYDRKV